VKDAPVPQRASGNSKTFFIAAQRDRIGGVGLEFDGVRSGIFGGMNDAYGLIKLLVVIGGEFGHDVNGAAVADLAACEFEGPRRLCFEQNLLPGWFFNFNLDDNGDYEHLQHCGFIGDCIVYSVAMLDFAAHWDKLHGDPRFRPMYPNDHVVRFVLTNRELLEKHHPARFLDIGLGAGRHTKLAAELGFRALGIDISLVGLQHARERVQTAGLHASLAQASMLALPFMDCSFAVVLSFGVFYYGTGKEMKQAVAEVRRILVPGGRAFVVLRTTDDYRFGKGTPLDHNTFQLSISETNELHSTQHFLAADDVPSYFAAFSHVSFEKAETTFGDRSGINSDWLITVEK
jgi:SAM-dependent methyltransferase